MPSAKSSAINNKTTAAVQRRASSKKTNGSSPLAAAPQEDIEDSEKWRLIKESGILGKVPRSSTLKAKYIQDEEEHDDDDELERDYIFEGIFFSIPTASLFIVMDILVHRQFGEGYALNQIVTKLAKVFPAVLLMVYFSNKFKSSKFTQVAMFSAATACGCYFLHTMFRSPALGIMRRAPGVITILVYCIVQLNLLPALICLAICGLYYRFGNATFKH
ncbi:hypothetical protein BGW38_010600 [Lunasporangiospora selenospora]|uniref:DUF7719 domain-containing protein n=1 Tax=Lunasporangiospora selenospora TaxID=979761 RepID=A0A9P6KFM2_9FUNG|nr:hypothetical protein BGW38_010600 [Lunasporangiospora selenospora]